MDWDQIEIKWAAMTRRVRIDLTGPAASEPALPGRDPPDDARATSAKTDAQDSAEPRQSATSRA